MAMLLADEPAARLDTWETAALGERPTAYAASGRAVVFIDHDLQLVRSICDRILVLDFGSEIGHGEPDEVLARPKVAHAYMGALPSTAPTAESATGGLITT